MNVLSLRRRWLVARPWLKDIMIGLSFIAGSVGAMWMLGHLADLCTNSGWCA